MQRNFYYTKLGKFTDPQNGDIVTIQIMRIGKRKHPVYGAFEVTAETLQEVIQNFIENKRWLELAVDENHEGNHIALGWIRELELQDNDTKLFAKIELTQLGAEKLARGEYKYFSPEIIWQTTDDETGEPITNLLIGWAFTNRPYFKGMQALKYNEDASNSNEDTTFYLFNDVQPMDKLLELLQKLLSAETMEQADLETMEAEYADKKGADDAEIAGMYAKVMGKKAQCTDGAGGDNAGGEPVKKDDPAVDPKATDDQKVQFTDPETGKEMSVSFAEFKAMQAKLETYAFTEKQKNVSEKLSSVVFSEENKIGMILPKHNNKLVDFAMWLSDAQFATFSEILQGLTTEAQALFNEEWAGGDGGELSRADKVEAKAKELIAEKNCSYKEAILEANKLVDVE